ncbi:MAG: DUF1802 family protein [Almyronema sp.]
MTTLTSALKEWSVAVDALASGQTILLLRKGGIREVGGGFSVSHRQVILYPTYEHQKPHLLKAAYQSAVQPVSAGWHPERVPLRAWADITDVWQVSEPSALAALQPFHIWHAQFATERFNWKPRQPLYLLLLRVYRLPEPVEIPYHASYGGCRSWLALQTAIAIDSASPVLSPEQYHHQRDRIQTELARYQPLPHKA